MLSLACTSPYLYVVIPLPTCAFPLGNEGGSYTEHAINSRRRRRIFEINSRLKINSHERKKKKKKR
jgi:hypothetical protein